MCAPDQHNRQQNTANGNSALFRNTTGYDNTATGISALVNNTTGNNNTADGLDALNYNTTGSNNIALGFDAGNKLFTGSNNIYIGTPEILVNPNDSHRQSRLQTKTFIAGISGVTVPAG